jgi:hypothetical protein
MPIMKWWHVVLIVLAVGLVQDVLATLATKALAPSSGGAS